MDVQILLPDGEPDPALPILNSLPLPAPMGGQEAVMFGFPEEGTTVVVSFAYGLPHKPFITQIKHFNSRSGPTGTGASKHRITLS